MKRWVRARGEGPEEKLKICKREEEKNGGRGSTEVFFFFHLVKPPPASEERPVTNVHQFVPWFASGLVSAVRCIPTFELKKKGGLLRAGAHVKLVCACIMCV
mmetsp:Transcript_40304/g.104472  ORF Transcript_40304/g.104472 Transcript_40304/m.104472 type:complete len:102 (+) Transcript_40304:4444-4749(+)